MRRTSLQVQEVAVFLLAVFLVSASHSVRAEPSQATKDRCAAYAQRAVQQYDLMTSHAACKVKDDLRWQGNLDNHYKGCLMLPEFLRKSEESARDDHLQACGGFAATDPANSAGQAGNSGIAPGASPGSTPSPSSSAGDGAAASAPASAASAPTPPPAASGPNPWAGRKAVIQGGVPLCTYQDGRIASSPNDFETGNGVQLNGNVLSYVPMQGPSKGKRVAFPVVRPQAYIDDPLCLGAQSMGGYWIYFAPKPIESRLFLVFPPGWPPGSHSNPTGNAQVMHAETLAVRH